MVPENKSNPTVQEKQRAVKKSIKRGQEFYDLPAIKS
jgi:hypothetical protein